MNADVELDHLRGQVAAVQRELKRRQWRQDPVAWAEERIEDHLWSKQKTILRSVRDNKETLVMSCHEIGKSFIASRAAAWWLDIHKPGEAAVVTTAPTNRQVKVILWKEIARVHSRGLAGRVNQKEWYMYVRDAKTNHEHEELVAFGFKPADWDPTAFQGIHARYILVIVDEACGVKGDALWNAIISLAANDNSRLLLFGNPDFVDTEFYEYAKPGSGFNVIQIGAFDTPCFTGEDVPPVLLEHLIGRNYVEKMRRKWAPEWRWVDADGKLSDAEHGRRCVPPPGSDGLDANPFWTSKVLGLFPLHSDPLALIPMIWVVQAQNREVESDGPIELGVDVGGGGDSSCVALRKGPIVRIIHEDHNPNTMQTCGKVIALMKEHGATAVKVDYIGIGRGMTERGQELEHPFHGVNWGEAASDPESFAKKRSEDWWALRERFEAGEIDLDPLDEETAAELCSLRFQRTSSGQIQVESKKEAKKRGVASPNRADAVCLAFSVLVKGKRKAGLVH